MQNNSNYNISTTNTYMHLEGSFDFKSIISILLTSFYKIKIYILVLALYKNLQQKKYFLAFLHQCLSVCLRNLLIYFAQYLLLWFMITRGVIILC